MEVRVTGHNFENWPLKDYPCHVCFKLAYWFQRRKFLNIFPIRSYVKTMSADGGHLGWRSGSLDIILKFDLLRIIHAMFALNWLTGFRLLNIFSIWSYVKIKLSHGGHLEFPIHKFSTGPPNDHSCKVTIQLAWWFLTRRFLKFQPMRTHYGPWQPCWISNQHQKHKSGRGPPNEHFWQVWFNSVQCF